MRTRPRPEKHLLHYEERWEAVRGAFAMKPDGQVDNLRILLLDDVMTTGATLDACAKALREAGASSVLGLTVARAIRPRWPRGRKVLTGRVRGERKKARGERLPGATFPRSGWRACVQRFGERGRPSSSCSSPPTFLPDAGTGPGSERYLRAHQCDRRAPGNGATAQRALRRRKRCIVRKYIRRQIPTKCLR